MPPRYRVRLDQDDHVFSAAHFITFDGDVCEHLHGHNFRVAVTVDGPLDENGYVLDFLALRDALKAITTELDHHLLLPLYHPAIQVEVVDDEVHVGFQQRRWVFPRSECRLLPLANTTAELLAHYIGTRLRDRLQQQLGLRPQRLEVAVDENHGQWALCELSDD